MHNQMKGKLKHQEKEKDENNLYRLSKYVVRSRGRANTCLRVQIRADAALHR